ncbi:BC_2427 family protein [Aeribacillus composti]|uniref:BC_2427 family protein n=1 Tax=Aeribacillus composti TaxID=1868734 RepID=UPI003D1AF100
MKTPWIHHERMQQIRSKQMNIFKSSRVQKKSVCPNFQHTEEDDDSHKSDIVPNRIDTAEADDSHENYDIKKVTKLNKNKNNVSKLMNLYKKYNMSKRNHTGSICGPTQPSNRTTDPEHVSSTDDHTLKTDDSHIKQISLPSPSHETKEHPSADSVLEPVHPSSNSDEINDQEDGFDTDPIDHSVDRAHSSSDGNDSELMPLANADHDLKTDCSSHDIKQISLPSPDHETKDQPPTDSVLEPVHPSSNSDEIDDQEDGFDTDPIDHSVDRAHSSSDGNDSELMPLANADHNLKTDCSSHDIKQISLPSPDHETKDHPPTDSVFEPVHTSSNSDEINDQEDDFDNDPIDHSVWPAHSSSNRTNSELVLFASNDHTLKMDGFSHVRRISLTDFEHHEKYDQDSMDSVFELVYTFASSSNEINDQEDHFETNSFDYSVELAHLLDENNLKQVFPAVDEHAVNTDEASHIKQISLTGLDEQETNDQPSTNSGFELVHAPSSSDEINNHKDIREINLINHTVEPVHSSSDDAVPEQSPPAVDEYAVNTDEYFHAGLEQETKDHPPTNSVFEFAHDSSSSDKINDQENISETNPIDYTVEPVHSSSDDVVPEQSPPAVDEYAVNTDEYFHAGLEQETNNQSTTNSVFEFAHDSSSSDKINDQENISETNPIDYTVEPVHSSDDAVPEQSPPAVDEHAVNTDEYFHAGLEQETKDHPPTDSVFESAHDSFNSGEINNQDIFKIHLINNTVEPVHLSDGADPEQSPSAVDEHAVKTDVASHADLEQDKKDHPADSAFEPAQDLSSLDEMNDQDVFKINFINHTVELTRPLDIADSEQVPTTDVVRASKMDETPHAAGLEQDIKDHALTDSVFEPVPASSGPDEINDQENIHETNFIDHKVEPDHSSDGVVPEQISSADVEHTVKTDEVSHAEQEINKKSPTDSVFEPVHPSSESDGTNDQKAINFDNADESIKYGKTCSMTIKRPFSTFVEIDDFLHSPIFSSIVQNSAEFLDLNNKQTPQLNTKLLNTTTYYPEQPDCRLVCSKIHEMISLTDTVSSYSKNNKNNHYKSIAVPLHDSKAAKTSETDNKTCTSHDFIQIRVPVVVGEYKMEIILEEDVVFEEEILGVKEISKEVVLTNCKFVPTQFSPSLDNGTCTALKGNLFIKGYISQNIEYTAADNGNEGSKQNESVPYYRQLHQKIILDLIVHLLQVQQVRVSYAGNGI